MKSGKWKTFSFSLGVGKRNRRTKQEQRVLARYALQEGGKDCEAGLKRKTKIILEVLGVKPRLTTSLRASETSVVISLFCCNNNKEDCRSRTAPSQ